MYLLSAIEQCEVESPPPEISGHIDRIKEMVPCPFSIPDSKKTSYSRRIWFLSHFKVWAFGLCQRNRKENNQLLCT